MLWATPIGSIFAASGPQVFAISRDEFGVSLYFREVKQRVTEESSGGFDPADIGQTE